MCPAMTIETPGAGSASGLHVAWCVSHLNLLSCHAPQLSLLWPGKSPEGSVGENWVYSLPKHRNMTPCMLMRCHPLKIDTATEDGRLPRMPSGPQTSGCNYSMWLAHKVLRCQQPHTGLRKEIKERGGCYGVPETVVRHPCGDVKEADDHTLKCRCHRRWLRDIS